MKKVIVVLALLSILVPVFGARRGASFHGGFFKPESADGGFIWGVRQLKFIDSKLTFGTGFDMLYLNYDDEKELGAKDPTGNVDVIKVEKSVDLKTYYFPVNASLILELPINPKLNFCGSFEAGWGLLWESVYRAEEDNFNEVDDIKFYHGFNYRVTAGVKYPLGEKSHIFGRALFSGAKLKRDVEKTDTGIIWDEVDMGGFGIIGGVGFSF